MLTTAVNEILNCKPSGDRLIVGVDGLSGAGKTTFVEALKKELSTHGAPLAVFHLDDHIVERAKRYLTGHEEWYEHYALQWDVAKLTHSLLEMLKSSVPEFELGYYDSRVDAVINRNVHVPAEGVILLEGVYLQRKEWRAFLDYLIYLDCPRSTRFERVTTRSQQDIADPARIDLYKRRYWAAEDYYLETEQPLLHADFVWENL